MKTDDVNPILLLLLCRAVCAVHVDNNYAIVGGPTTSRLNKVIYLVNCRHPTWPGGDGVVDELTDEQDSCLLCFSHYDCRRRHRYHRHRRHHHQINFYGCR